MRSQATEPLAQVTISVSQTRLGASFRQHDEIVDRTQKARVCGLSARIAALNNANGDAGTYEIRGAIKRGSGVATTAILGTPAVTTVGADAGASAWAVAAVANTTLGSLEIQVTGAASTTIKWVASVWTTEVVG